MNSIAGAVLKNGVSKLIRNIKKKLNKSRNKQSTKTSFAFSHSNSTDFSCCYCWFFSFLFRSCIQKHCMWFSIVHIFNVSGRPVDLFIFFLLLFYSGFSSSLESVPLIQIFDAMKSIERTNKQTKKNIKINLRKVKVDLNLFSDSIIRLIHLQIFFMIFIHFVFLLNIFIWLKHHFFLLWTNGIWTEIQRTVETKYLFAKHRLTELFNLFEFIGNAKHYFDSLLWANIYEYEKSVLYWYIYKKRIREMQCCEKKSFESVSMFQFRELRVFFIKFRWKSQ